MADEKPLSANGVPAKAGSSIIGGSAPEPYAIPGHAKDDKSKETYILKEDGSFITKLTPLPPTVGVGVEAAASYQIGENSLTGQKSAKYTKDYKPEKIFIQTPDGNFLEVSSSYIAKDDDKLHSGGASFTPSAYHDAGNMVHAIEGKVTDEHDNKTISKKEMDDFAKAHTMIPPEIKKLIQDTYQSLPPEVPAQGNEQEKKLAKEEGAVNKEDFIKALAEKLSNPNTGVKLGEPAHTNLPASAKTSVPSGERAK